MPNRKFETEYENIVYNDGTDMGSNAYPAEQGIEFCDGEIHGMPSTDRSYDNQLKKYESDDCPWDALMDALSFGYSDSLTDSFNEWCEDKGVSTNDESFYEWVDTIPWQD